MKKVISTEKKPIKLWLDDIEDGALAQVRNLANLPFVFKHIAIMPDSHLGYGMPIGAVMATQGVIIPNAVGVDIGCGMCAVKTSLTDLSQDALKKILGGIRSKIPAGFSKHNQRQDESLMPSLDHLIYLGGSVVADNYDRAMQQLGTLGGGNHFIEIQKGDDGYIWLMIHSGSRNLGHTVAKGYNKAATVLHRKWHTSVPEKWQLAFLPLDSDEGQAYLKEMQYCVEYAFANRKLMMDRTLNCVREVVGNEVSAYRIINVAHNYAAMENHFDENVMVHRKGATSARNGQFGIIPGSQGTSSYIVEGKGNPESFGSCSHGAGRLMSRTAAKNTLNLESEKKRLDDHGVIHGMRNVKDLDEAPGAYKDIKTVMRNQEDLVSIEVELKPLAVVKG
jgi:tRNA-splicing ligase RtcB